jgi:hypothetical protein
MFILKCPNCKHESRVKFARMGATAKCIGCKQPFPVDASTLAMEQGAGAGEAKPEPVVQKLTPVEELHVPRPAVDAPVVEAAVPVGEATLADLAQQVAVEAPPPPMLPHVTRRRRRVDPMLVGLFAIICLGFGGLAWLLFGGGEDPDFTTKPPANTGTTQRPPDTAGVTPTPSSPDKSTPSATERPSTGAGTVPTLALSASLSSQPTWTRVNPPREPFSTSMSSDAAIWSPRIQHRPDGQALFTGLYVGSTSTIYRAGFLHVRLLNNQGLVYAEMKQTVPVLPGRQGVQITTPIPTEYLSEFHQLVADLTPLEPLSDVGAVELVESQVKFVDSAGPWPRLQMAVANPFSQRVNDLTLVLAVLTADGYPLGEWRGTLAGAIGPHETITFEATPPVGGDVKVGRLMLRGYALKP